MIVLLHCKATERKANWKADYCSIFLTFLSAGIFEINPFDPLWPDHGCRKAEEEAVWSQAAQNPTKHRIVIYHPAELTFRAVPPPHPSCLHPSCLHPSCLHPGLLHHRSPFLFSCNELSHLSALPRACSPWFYRVFKAAFFIWWRFWVCLGN